MSKIVFITGGTRGIGKATAELFYKKGYKVAITYIKSDNIARQMITEMPDRFMAIKCDVSDTNQVNDAFMKVNTTLGGIDILVNNAGISSQKMLCDVSEEEWDSMFAVNVKSMYNTVKASLNYMVHKKSGNIINLSSIWGISGASCEVCYSATKAAVIGFTKALASELGPSGIRVNCVAPGVIDTDMNKMHDKETINMLSYDTPLGRMGTSEEVAKCIEFLASEDSSFITGQIISPNGGFLI